MRQPQRRTAPTQRRADPKRGSLRETGGATERTSPVLLGFLLVAPLSHRDRPLTLGHAARPSAGLDSRRESSHRSLGHARPPEHRSLLRGRIRAPGRIFRFAIANDFCHLPGPLTTPSESIQCKPLQVVVDGKGVERAIKHLKRKLAAEGLLRELKKRRHYMKPSIKKRKKIAEAARRRRKRERTVE